MTNVMLAASLLVGVALTGCGGTAAAAGLSVEDKKALDDPLFAAELAVPGICPSNTTRSDPDANKCAALLTVTTAKIAAVHAVARQRGVRDTFLDSSADEVDRFTKVCDPKGSAPSISECLGGAGKIKSNAETYVQTLRGKLNAVK
ncbi:MAG TPA: hypothetical protein VF885_07460 [Arthrobacter sp.]